MRSPNWLGHSEDQYAETTAGTDDLKLHWWKIDSADVRRRDISGWVREQNFAGGRVTREFAQKWVDFQTLADAHDPTHTIFATTQAYVDYAIGADVPHPGSLDKLSRLMTSIYRTLYPTGDGSHAADELRAAAQDPWTALRMSRLIVKHESEWANPNKWQPLITEIEKRTGPQAQHAEELKRIEKLVWWEEVKPKLPDLPAPEVFHIHPIGLVGNFIRRHAQGSSRFPSDVIEAAQAAQAKWGIPASVSLAQWAFESGFGRHVPPCSNNPFGIKASKQDMKEGNYVNAMTSEVVHGERIHISQPFRIFSSIADAFDYHGRLLATGPAYTQARQGLPDPCALAIGLTDHNATEPNYGQKLIDGYIKPNELTQYDSF